MNELQGGCKDDNGAYVLFSILREMPEAESRTTSNKFGTSTRNGTWHGAECRPVPTLVSLVRVLTYCRLSPPRSPDSKRPLAKRRPFSLSPRTVGAASQGREGFGHLHKRSASCAESEMLPFGRAVGRWQTHSKRRNRRQCSLATLDVQEP